MFKVASSRSKCFPDSGTHPSSFLSLYVWLCPSARWRKTKRERDIGEKERELQRDLIRFILGRPWTFTCFYFCTKANEFTKVKWVSTCGGVRELPWSEAHATTDANQHVELFRILMEKNQHWILKKYKQARFLRQTDMGCERRSCPTSTQILPEWPFLPPCGLNYTVYPHNPHASLIFIQTALLHLNINTRLSVHHEWPLLLWVFCIAMLQV